MEMNHSFLLMTSLNKPELLFYITSIKYSKCFLKVRNFFKFLEDEEDAGISPAPEVELRRQLVR